MRAPNAKTTDVTEFNQTGFGRFLRWSVVAIAIASPLAVSGCYFLAGAAAGAGAYAVADDPPDSDDDDE